MALSIFHLKRATTLLTFIIPFSFLLLSQTPHFTDNISQLSGAITFDLLITTPAIYFLIIRKRSIPKTTVVPVFVLGVVIASIILPVEHQSHLSLVKQWFIPILEIAVFLYIGFTIRKGYKELKKSNVIELDFFSAAKKASLHILPKRLAILFATELSVFYYGLLNWKKRKLQANEFSYHKDTGVIALLVVVIFLILVETAAVHLLLLRWSSTGAWVLSGLSIYTCFQVLGILKSIAKRPIIIAEDGLILKWGILNEARIDFKNIQEIHLLSKDLEKRDGLAFLSPFHSSEGHKVLIKLTDQSKMIGFYGFKKTFQEIAFYVDHPADFVECVEKKMRA